MSEPDEYFDGGGWIVFEEIPQSEGRNADRYKIKRDNKGNINFGATIGDRKNQLEHVSVLDVGCPWRANPIRAGIAQKIGEY